MASLPKSRPKLPVAVDKPTPYTFDLGLLLANDPNPTEIDKTKLEDSLAAIARDGAQALINQMLTTCAISSSKEGVLLSLPAVSTPLPREKPVPAAKAETKWEAFAKRRGIKAKTREQRRNIQYNETTGEWGRKWGYKGANKAGEDDAIVEVNMKQEAALAEGKTIRGMKRQERKERVKKNERQMKRNQRNAEKR